MVDEATDFSPIQLACMVALSDPKTRSVVACGDFHQRLTLWGTRSEGDLRWVSPKIDIQQISVTYRHSRQLNDFAHRVIRLSGKVVEKPELPEHLRHDGYNPVLATSVQGDALAKWLADRITEIEKLSQKLPSIAVLVNGEDEVQALATAVNEQLVNFNIRCVACPNGQVKGQEQDVRVFDVRHIKGLEFEAVFFVGIDHLASEQSELFDKYLYVGATRAATFLGLTCSGPQLPAPLQRLSDVFGQSWT
jgi:DNA helicase IV